MTTPPMQTWKITATWLTLVQSQMTFADVDLLPYALSLWERVRVRVPKGRLRLLQRFRGHAPGGVAVGLLHTALL